MTSNELLAILEKEKIPSCYYKIYDIGGPVEKNTHAMTLVVV